MPHVRIELLSITVVVKEKKAENAFGSERSEPALDAFAATMTNAAPAPQMQQLATEASRAVFAILGYSTAQGSSYRFERSHTAGGPLAGVGIFLGHRQRLKLMTQHS